MNIYYRVTQVDYTRGTTYYELEIPFQSYYITIYTFTGHLPHKRLAKYRPISYFMIFPGENLGIIVCQKDRDAQEPDHMAEMENLDRGKLKLLIEKISKAGAIKSKDIVNEFLKTL